MRVIRSINRLNIDNMGLSGIGENPSKFSVDFNMTTMNIYIYKL